MKASNFSIKPSNNFKQSQYLKKIAEELNTKVISYNLLVSYFQNESFVFSKTSIIIRLYKKKEPERPSLSLPGGVKRQQLKT